MLTENVWLFHFIMFWHKNVNNIALHLPKIPQSNICNNGKNTLTVKSCAHSAGWNPNVFFEKRKKKFSVITCSWQVVPCQLKTMTVGKCRLLKIRQSYQLSMLMCIGVTKELIFYFRSRFRTLAFDFRFLFTIAELLEFPN